MEGTIHRDAFLPGLYEVAYWPDDGHPLFGMQQPYDILKALRDPNLEVSFVHFTGGGRPNKTYHRPVPCGVKTADRRRIDGG